MPRPEHYSLRVPDGTTDRIRRLADLIGISVAEWCGRACRSYACIDETTGCCRDSEVIAIPRLRAQLTAGNVRSGILYALEQAERRAPRPPVIDPVEQEAARGAVIVDAMEEA
jgi:hypothetical protein